MVTPEKILAEVGLVSGQVVADFGAGSGFYTIPAAKIVGERGAVYAIDILPPILEIIASRAKQAGLVNVTVVKGDLERENGSTLHDDFCDVVLMSNILFQSESKTAFMAEAARILKPGGILALVEWIPAKIPTQDSLYPVAEVDVKKLADDKGFKFERNFEVDTMHYGLIFIKPE